MVVVKLHAGLTWLTSRVDAPAGQTASIQAERAVREEVEEETLLVARGAGDVLGVVVVVYDLVDGRLVGLGELGVGVRAVEALLVGVDGGLPVVVAGVLEGAAQRDLSEVCVRGLLLEAREEVLKGAGLVGQGQEKEPGGS